MILPTLVKVKECGWEQHQTWTVWVTCECCGETQPREVKGPWK